VFAEVYPVLGYVDSDGWYSVPLQWLML